MKRVTDFFHAMKKSERAKLVPTWWSLPEFAVLLFKNFAMFFVDKKCLLYLKKRSDSMFDFTFKISK